MGVAPSGVISTELSESPEILSFFLAPSGRVGAPDGMKEVGGSPVRHDCCPVRDDGAGTVFYPKSYHFGLEFGKDFSVDIFCT